VCWYADPIRKDRGALRASTGDGTAQVPVPPVYRSVLHAVVQCSQKRGILPALGDAMNFDGMTDVAFAKWFAARFAAVFLLIVAIGLYVMPSWVFLAPLLAIAFGVSHIAVVMWKEFADESDELDTIQLDIRMEQEHGGS
jgi:hypothetical protein